MIFTADTKKQTQKRLLRFAAIFIITLIALAVSGLAIAMAIEHKFEKKIYPGIFISTVPVGGMAQEDAMAILNAYETQLGGNGIRFLHEDRAFPIYSTYTALLDPDLSYEIVSLDNSAAVKQAYAIGRKGGIHDRWNERLNAWRKTKRISLPYTLDRSALIKILRENFKAYEEPAIDARFSVTKNGEVNISSDALGLGFDYEKAADNFADNIAQLTLKDIEMLQIIVQPSVKKQDIAQLAQDFTTFMAARTPVALAYEEKKFTHAVPPETYQEWFTSRKTDRGASTLTFDPQKISAYLEKEIAPKIKVPVKEARFQIENGVVKEFVPSARGLDLSIAETTASLIATVFEKSTFDVALVVRVIEPQYTTEKTNTLGIKEIMGTGHSNFAGSPKNRRHNIAVGAASINGILIPPEQEFSLITALGDIDAEAGYLPELVIKGNKTLPEYGGGLCQIGTTVFRATMETGLPVTERQNHSYQVPYYYENGVSGTDATIYGPHPDFKFINDTKQHVLIQSRIEGDDLYVDFWGTQDGRIPKRTVPVISNVLAPAPTKYINTTSLPEGEKKCTERAHTGADAEFTYTVTYQNGEKKEKKFKSRYRPWQAVCLVGIKAEEVPQPEENAKKEIPSGIPITP